MLLPLLSLSNFSCAAILAAYSSSESFFGQKPSQLFFSCFQVAATSIAELAGAADAFLTSLWERYLSRWIEASLNRYCNVTPRIEPEIMLAGITLVPPTRFMCWQLAIGKEDRKHVLLMPFNTPPVIPAAIKESSNDCLLNSDQVELPKLAAGVADFLDGSDSSPGSLAVRPSAILRRSYSFQGRYRTNRGLTKSSLVPTLQRV